MKRVGEVIYNICDFILAVFLLIAASPLFILAAVLVEIDNTGSILYTQKRLTKDRKVFFIYKFRTMRENIEHGRPVWGHENDNRSSAIGNFLRCTHIDELPQLINVLKGEMSIVGPRPERPYFAEQFEQTIPGYSERYKVKAGITGWAQVNGWRGDSSMLERLMFDRFYIDNRSLLFNIKIFLLTPFSRPINYSESPVDEKLHYIYTWPYISKAHLKDKALGAHSYHYH